MAGQSYHQKGLFSIGTLLLLFSYVVCMESPRKSLTPSDLEKANQSQANADKSFASSAGIVTTRADQTTSTVSKTLVNTMKILATEFDNLDAEFDQIRAAMREEAIRRQDTFRTASQRMEELERNRASGHTPVVTSYAPPTGPVAPVAFSGGLTHKLNSTEGDVIKFGLLHIVTQLGFPYSPFTGKFRCPVKGLYHFWMTIAAPTNEQLVTEILVNGNRRSLNHAGGRWYGGTGTSVVNLVLNAGDIVWAQNVNSKVEKTHLWWTNFNGYLIKQMA